MKIFCCPFLRRKIFVLSPFCFPKFCAPPKFQEPPCCGNKWHFPYFWLMLSVSSSLHLSVALDKENSVSQKGQVRPWLGACRTAQIRESIREVSQLVIIIVVREWGHLFINLQFIYLFIYSESATYCILSEMFGRTKFPEFSVMLLKWSENSLSFPGFPWFFPKSPLFQVFPELYKPCQTCITELNGTESISVT